jgi:hypothetical protein
MARRRNAFTEAGEPAEPAPEIGMGQAFNLVPADVENGEPEHLDPDSEQDWDEWGQALKMAEASGTVRVFKIPTGVDGQPDFNSKGSRQIQCGSFMHSQYSFDDLCALIKKDYMRAGETSAFRFMGFTPGQRGVRFNRVVTLMKTGSASSTIENGGGGASELGTILQAIQVQQNQTAQMMERILTPRESQSNALETFTKTAAVLGPILAPVLAAWISKPARRTELGEMITAISALKDMANGGDGNGGNDDNSTLGLIKALAPVAGQLFQAMNQQRQAVPVMRQPRRRLQAPPAPQPVAPPSPPPQIELSPEDKKVLAQLLPQLEQLAALAAEGANAAETAKLVMESLPEDAALDEQLYNFLSNDRAYNAIFAVKPVLQQHRPWFDALRAGMLAEYTGPEEEETAPAVTKTATPV